MFSAIKQSAAKTAKRSALGLLGGLIMAFGVAFLTVAAWIAISISADPFTAALIIGSVYTGVGLIILAFALSKKPHARPSTPPQTANYGAVVESFINGFAAGSTVRHRK